VRDDRLLLSLKGYIGDAVMTAPLLNRLEAEFRHVTLLTAPVARDVLRADASAPYLPLVKERTPWLVVQQAIRLRKERFRIVVLVNRSFRSALVARLAGIPVRVGHNSEGRAPLLTHAVPFDEEKFEAFCSLDLASPLNLDPSPERPRLHIQTAERKVGSEMLDGATVGFQPGARFPKKQVPIPVLAEVARSLIARGHRLALFGGPEESADAEAFSGIVGGEVVNLVGRCRIRETIGTVSHLRLMIGSDTGVMHLAAGAGCPTVTVFGPTKANKWGHDYEPHTVLRSEDGDITRIRAEEILGAALARLEGV